MVAFTRLIVEQDRSAAVVGDDNVDTPVVVVVTDAEAAGRVRLLKGFARRFADVHQLCAVIVE